MDTNIEDWNLQSKLYKDRGNELFQKGDIKGSIDAYSKAISVDPDNHILYSNRSAAYMKDNMISKALKDAEKCVEINHDWAKGYCRLGSAQTSLGRFDTAIETFKLGLTKDKNNNPLIDGLALCKKLKNGKSVYNNNNNINNDSDNSMKQRINLPKDDNQLSDFFSILERSKLESDKKKDEDASKAMQEARKLNKYAQQSLGSSMDQFSRLTCKNHQWKNLNPYYVLNLGIDATEDDIKLRYRKLAGLLHPDKIRLDSNATTTSASSDSNSSNRVDTIPIDKNLAFEYVKTSYQTLCDETQRSTIIANITIVKEDLEKEWKIKTNTDPNTNSNATDKDEFEKELDTRLLKHFADIEFEKRRSENLIRSHNAREREAERQQEESDHAVKDFENAWKNKERVEKRVENWRQFQPPAKSRKI